MAQAPPPVSPPPAPEPISRHEGHGWTFEAESEPLWPSNRIDDLCAEEGLCKVPDMYCGNAALRIRHPETGFNLTLDTLGMLRSCRWKPPPKPSNQPLRETLPTRESEGEEAPLLGSVKCQFAAKWKPKGDNPDVKELEVSSDWTCCSPYWGDASMTPKDGEESVPVVPEVTQDELPMDELRRRDEIHWHNEVFFWEDELDDNGVCRASVRVRVMPTFWFVLLQCELRVDNVLIRDVSTRFFHSFGSDHVLREWTWREVPFQALKEKGLQIAGNPAISQMSVGTILLGEGDVKQRLRHHLPVKAGV
mmetsp:Transcript_89206/g.186431  ORF Transcript_89206/g.186431 Transcript_89206/m.186431 type:complete len:306 (-) Transcript_89206:57-974(-)